ncbi:MAG TPA: hypothetical protein VIG97_08845 [Luteimonas sp.]
MERSGFVVSRVWITGLLVIACTTLAPLAHGQEAVHPSSAAGQPRELDEAAIKAELRRMVEQRKRELRPEYERRVRTDGKASADRWLREAAAELGRRDGAEMRAKYGH